MEEVKVMVADESHIKYIDTILTTIAEAAKKRGSGIAKRSPEYVATKMREAKAVIALQGEKFAGFSYIETWGNKHYVTTSGLIVHPDFRGLGLAKRIKNLTFTLARQRWPHAKIFSLTSGSAVMKMNTQLGYLPVTFADLTDDESFWRGCEGCINVDVLHRTNRKYCICTAMLDPIGRQEVLSAVHKLNREKGITVVLITHHMNEAEEADRVIVMDDGRIALDGTPKEVFTQVEPLRTMGLTVPDTVDLLDRLRKDGLDVPLDALTVDECAAAITAALAKN